MSVQQQNRSLVPDMGNFSSIISRRLQTIYKSEFSESLVNRILALTAERFPSYPDLNERDILLITYGNSIVKKDEVPLSTLKYFLDEYLAECMNCVHILPFFPFTSDDGFAVSDFNQVNPELGNWHHIQSISEKYRLMFDLVLNHVSSAHPWFRNFLHDEMPGKGYFIEAREGWDYTMVVRPRSTPLFSVFESVSGSKKVWTTFSSDQADLNFSNPEVLLEMIRVLIFLISKGASFIRLDAIAYIWKREGTPCLHLNETHEIVRLLRDIAGYVSPGVLIVTETNVPNEENWSYFGKGDEAHMVYQFSLPPLLLYAFFSGNAAYLNDWVDLIPDIKPDQTFLNYTASHDGIGVRPLEGLIPDAEMALLIEGMVNFGGKISMKSNKSGTLSPYEMNITYYDAMKGTKEGVDLLQQQRFICSQTIMMAMKGIPAFYIHSLVASHNDNKGVEATGRVRSINRSQLDINELEKEIAAGGERAQVFNELRRLIKIRRAHKAFHIASRQEILRVNSQVFAFVRHDHKSGEKIYCISNISTKEVNVPVKWSPHKMGYDLISESVITEKDHIPMRPCQTIWLTEAPIINP